MIIAGVYCYKEFFMESVVMTCMTWHDVDIDNYDDNDEDYNTYNNDVVITWKATSETTAMRENDNKDDDANGDYLL
jgi:hypothetical protein